MNGKKQIRWGSIATLVGALAGAIAIITFVTGRSSLPDLFAPPTSEPSASAFEACIDPCTGQNATTSFPEGTKRINARWKYSNIPAGAAYVRTWSMEQKEWVRYQCAWDGPKSGSDSVVLREPKGLRSGTWEMVISVNDRVILSQKIIVEGNITVWEPAGTVNACHAK